MGTTRLKRNQDSRKLDKQQTFIEELAIEPKGGGAAINPAGPPAHGLLHGLALLDPWTPDDQQQVEQAVGKGADELIQLLVGTQDQRACGQVGRSCHQQTFPGQPPQGAGATSQRG